MSLHQSIELDGVITFWSLASHSSRDDLKVSLGAIDPELAKLVPEERTLSTGLVADALKELFPGKNGYMIRQLKKDKGWIVKREVVEDDDVRLDKVCRVKVEVQENSDGSKTEYVDVKQGYTSEMYHNLLSAIDRQKGLAPAEQVSKMLTAILKSFPGVVSLRPSGGIYVLTDDQSKRTWRLVATAVGVSGANTKTNKVYRVDYKVNEYSLEAIRDALLEEVKLFSENLENEINETDPEKQLGARALKNRQKSAEEMLRRVEFLENALSCRLTDAREMVERVKTAAGQVALLSTVTVSA